MMIKITQKCSMGCTHCMNDAKSNGQHMDFSTFMNVIEFQKKHGGPACLITGGEPFEHPEFWDFILYAMAELPGVVITVATNGLALADPANAALVETAYKKRYPLLFQVSTDPEYYPIQLDTSLPIYHSKNVTLIDKIPKIYPQGRAVTNNLKWSAIGSKCCNVRCVAKQLKDPTLFITNIMLLANNKLCTPHIDIYGGIKLGESDLCPTCSTIYKKEDEIMSSIINFTCDKCDHINKNLPQEIKKLLGIK